MAKRSDDADFDDDSLEDSPPPAKTSMLTIVLCFLNVAAAVGFAILLVLDYSKRQEWSYAVFLRDLAIDGLPLAEEELAPTASRETRPKKKLTPEQLKAEFGKRPKQAVREDFQAVDESFPNRILPQHLTQEILEEVFKGYGPPVKTLEDEIKRLIIDLPKDLDKAAQEIVASLKTEPEKRAKLASLLLPLATRVQQIEAVEKKIKDAPPAKLDDLLADAAHRRMLVDILAPLEIQRPTDLKNRLLDNSVDFEAVQLDDLQKLLKQRLSAVIADKHDSGVFFGEDWANQARDSIDKRTAIAFTLFTIAHVRKPDGKGTLLYDNGFDRVRVVVGWHEFALASQALTRSLEALRDQVVRAIRHDRQGIELEIRAEHYQERIDYYTKMEKDNANNKGKLEEAKDKLEQLNQLKNKLGVSYNPGFTQHQAAEIQKIHELHAMIQNRLARFDDLKDQLKNHEIITKDRKEHLDATVVDLIKSRALTAKEVEKNRVLQRQMFEAQRELENAFDINVQLEQEIRRLEGVKGGRLP